MQPESLLRYLLLPGSPLLPRPDVLPAEVLPGSPLLPGSEVLHNLVLLPGSEVLQQLRLLLDRKSTRLNSSH